MPRKTHNRLYIARWPDGSARLFTATSLEHAADLLDEVGDPGACEVAVYNGPLVIDIEPAAKIDGGCLDVHVGSFEEEDAELGLLEVAFPLLHAVVAAAREDGDDPTPEAWSRALKDEEARALRPSSDWSQAIASWWQGLSGGRPDQTAALRQMVGVSIPGEPKPETPEQQAMFESAQRRMLEHVAVTLRSPPDEPSRPRPERRRTKKT